MEDQIGAFGLVPAALVLFNTRYMDADSPGSVAARSATVPSPGSPGSCRYHVDVLDRYFFQLPDRRPRARRQRRRMTGRRSGPLTL